MMMDALLQQAATQLAEEMLHALEDEPQYRVATHAGHLTRRHHDAMRRAAITDMANLALNDILRRHSKPCRLSQACSRAMLATADDFCQQVHPAFRTRAVEQAQARAPPTLETRYCHLRVEGEGRARWRERDDRKMKHDA